jgi:hypothetical protein
MIDALCYDYRINNRINNGFQRAYGITSKYKYVQFSKSGEDIN